MKDTMEYNGYSGSVHYNDDDKVFYGKLEFICALVSYEGTDVVSLRTAFEEAVDDYLEFCKETGSNLKNHSRAPSIFALVPSSTSAL